MWYIFAVNELKLVHIGEGLQRYSTDWKRTILLMAAILWADYKIVPCQSVKYFCNPSCICASFNSFTEKIYQTKFFYCHFSFLVHFHDIRIPFKIKTCQLLITKHTRYVIIIIHSRTLQTYKLMLCYYRLSFCRRDAPWLNYPKSLTRRNIN